MISKKSILQICVRHRSEWIYLVLFVFCWYFAWIFITLERQTQLQMPVPEEEDIVNDKRSQSPLMSGCSTWIFKNTTAIDLNPDDDEVIDYIRKCHLVPPSPPESLYHLETKHDIARIAARLWPNSQYRLVRKFLNNKRNGIFLEAGANDGAFISNTIDLESKLNWTGILIEPDPVPYATLLERNRKAWKSNVCLSPVNYPITVDMIGNDKQPGLGNIPHLYDGPKLKSGIRRFVARCFPLYSILVALNITELDYMSIDIEGADLEVLKTFPFHLVKVGIISVEANTQSRVDEFQKFFETVGFTLYQRIIAEFTNDVIFVPSRRRQFRTPKLDSS